MLVPESMNHNQLHLCKGKAQQQQGIHHLVPMLKNHTHKPQLHQIQKTKPTHFIIHRIINWVLIKKPNFKRGTKEIQEDSE